MRIIKKIFLTVLAFGFFFVGSKVEAKTVAWSDLIDRISNGRVAEYVRNEQTNGENIQLNINSDSSKFVATVNSNGVEVVFQLDYSDGKVSFTDTTTASASDDVKVLADKINTMWVQDVIIYAGVLYNYKTDDVTNLIVSGDFNNLTLANDGIEMSSMDYSIVQGGNTFNGKFITSFKLDLVNGFAGLEEIPDPDCVTDPEPTPTPTPDTSTPVENPTTPTEEAPVKNPSTGDISVYQIAGGIVLCMGVAFGAIHHLRKKEEII